MDGSGEHHYIQEDAYTIEIYNQRLNLKDFDGQVIEDVKGIIVNPPAHTVMDNYYDAQNYIEKGIPVMTLFIDGFSYKQWKRLRQASPNLYISRLNFLKATTVYRPVTNAGFAAMLSGQTPNQSGVMDRSVRQLACETLYDQVEEGSLLMALLMF